MGKEWDKENYEDISNLVGFYIERQTRRVSIAFIEILKELLPDPIEKEKVENIKNILCRHGIEIDI